jgi:parvulin-like peptidyl-prolyl isomerase
LGWLPLTFLPAKERASLQRVKIGSIIGPFADQNGLTILKVEGRNPHYQLTPQQQLSMRQQIFATWVQRLQSRAAVQRDVTV